VAIKNFPYLVMTALGVQTN